MRVSLFSVLSVLAPVALAAKPNPFNVPEGFSLTAGKPTTLKWTPTTPGTVTLRLRQGASNNLEAGTVIQANIPNNGSYTYTPPADTTRGSDYSIEIVSDSDHSQANFSPYFVLESSNTVASASGASSASGTPSTSAAFSTVAAASTESGSSSTTGRSMTGRTTTGGSTTGGSTMSSTTNKSAQSATSTGSSMTNTTNTAKTSTGTSTAGTTSTPASQPANGTGVMAVPSMFTAMVAVLLVTIASW